MKNEKLQFFHSTGSSLRLTRFMSLIQRVFDSHDLLDYFWYQQHGHKYMKKSLSHIFLVLHHLEISEFSELCVTFWLESIPRPNWPCCGYGKSSTRSGLSNTCRIKFTRRLKRILESKRRTTCKTMLIRGIYKQRVTPRGDCKVHFEHPPLYFVRLIQYRGAQELDEFISQLENESERKKLANLVMTG